MRIYKDLDMVEQLGSGLPRILARYPQRSFNFSNSFLRVIFQSYVEDIGGSVTLSPHQEEIINLIKQDKKISYRAMAQQLGINESAVKKHLNTLKQQNIIERVGGTRGYWDIKH